VDSFPTDVAMAAVCDAQRLLSRPRVCCVCENMAVAVCLDCTDQFCGGCRYSLSIHISFESLVNRTRPSCFFSPRPYFPGFLEILLAHFLLGLGLWVRVNVSVSYC
jgi:hypothetical protein